MIEYQEGGEVVDQYPLIQNVRGKFSIENNDYLDIHWGDGLTSGSLYIKIYTNKEKTEFKEYRIDISDAEEARRISIGGITDKDRYNEITPLIKKIYECFPGLTNYDESLFKTYGGKRKPRRSRKNNRKARKSRKSKSKKKKIT